MQRYWINPDYKIREEFWGSLAYFLEDITWEIGKDATNILNICNGKTKEEIISLIKLNPQDVSTFLDNALKNNLLVLKKPKKIRLIIKRNFKPEFCLTAPNGIFFEVTYRCNMKCKHCYTSSENRNFDSKDMKELTTKQIFNLIDQASKMGVFVISLGGGEPFIREDILKILEYGAKKDIEMIPVTNGFFLNEQIIKKIKSSKIRQVVVSLDGSNKDVYVKIRGNDIFNKVIENIKLLVKNRIRVLINCVVTKENLHDLENIIKLVKKLGVRGIRFIRLTPSGRAKDNQNLWLDIEDYKFFVKNLQELSKKYSENGFVVLKDEAFLGLFSDQKIIKRMSWLPEKYCGCPAGRSFIFLDPFGNIYPCGYLEFKEFLIGNIKKLKLEDVWQNKTSNKTLDFFRKMEKLNPYCDSCKNKAMCQGGCRGTAYLKYKNLLARDALCFREIMEKEIIRDMTESDIESVSQLIIRNLKEINNKDYSQETVTMLVEDYNPEGIRNRIKLGKMIVFEKDNKILGVGRILNGEIFDIFVLPENHKHGIGKKIMQTLEAIAKQEKFKEISLPASKTAIDFYKKLGYQIKDTEKKSESSTWMFKNLK